MTQLSQFNHNICEKLTRMNLVFSDFTSLTKKQPISKVKWWEQKSTPSRVCCGIFFSVAGRVATPVNFF